MKKIFSILLAVVLLFCSVPTDVQAATTIKKTVAVSGTGFKVTATLTKETGSRPYISKVSNLSVKGWSNFFAWEEFTVKSYTYSVVDGGMGVKVTINGTVHSHVNGTFQTNSWSDTLTAYFYA